MCNFNRHLNCDTVLADWTDEGKVFQKIIERGIKLARRDILLTAGAPSSQCSSLRFQEHMQLVVAMWVWYSDR